MMKLISATSPQSIAEEMHRQLIAGEWCDMSFSTDDGEYVERVAKRASVRVTFDDGGSEALTHAVWSTWEMIDSAVDSSVLVPPVGDIRESVDQAIASRMARIEADANNAAYRHGRGK